ncbi:hypothetical protein TWF730_007330 [Orbilia blumenaviensis]|uniref:Uncharacterized protein n=1 Tax=Orbilia blumenaviensis TaxID=1796055 RepID=A0AAV9V7E3_9PEZI
MSYRSAWTKLTSYGQTLRSSLQRISRNGRPRVAFSGLANPISPRNVGEIGATNGPLGNGTATGRDQSLGQIGTSNEPSNLQNGPKHESHSHNIFPGGQESSRVLEGVDRPKASENDLGQTLGPVVPINSSTASTESKNQKQKGSGLGRKGLKRNPSAAAAIDNLLDSISDPRIQFLSAPPPEQKKPKDSKVTIDALLQSIPAPRAGVSKSLSEEHLTTVRRKIRAPVADIEDEISDEPYINIANISPAWVKKTGSRAYHILRLDNCGSTMIKSDIERIFYNYHARRVDWNFTIVPARTNIRLQRKNRYYLYFDSDEAAKHHLAHFAELLKSEKKNGRPHTITLPPPAAAQTFLESKAPDIDLDSEVLQGSAASVSKYWVPKLSLVNPLKMPLDGVIPNLLYQAGGAPGRTVLISLCANSHRSILHIWLRHSLIEKYGFGRWLVPGGDTNGRGLERIPTVGPNTPEPPQGGRWVVRFRDGFSSEAERLVREWDGKWVNVRGKWGILRAEVLW